MLRDGPHHTLSIPVTRFCTRSPKYIYSHDKRVNIMFSDRSTNRAKIKSNAYQWQRIEQVGLETRARAAYCQDALVRREASRRRTAGVVGSDSGRRRVDWARSQYIFGPVGPGSPRLGGQLRRSSRQAQIGPSLNLENQTCACKERQRGRSPDLGNLKCWHPTARYLTGAGSPHR